MSLRSTLDALAASFANEIIAAIRGASLQELLGVQGTTTRGGSVGSGRTPARAPKVTTPGRLKRRSAEDVAAALGDVVALVKRHKDGLRAEQIRTSLGLQSKELPRVLKEGLATKMLSKKGQKRSTTYFATR
jgi:hypothetical protein